jgi:hypothetical protein
MSKPSPWWFCIGSFRFGDPETYQATELHHLMGTTGPLVQLRMGDHRGLSFANQ